MLINANALSIPLTAKSVHTVVTSPPYYGLRDYGVDGQIGLEVTPDEYIANLVAVFRECKRILRDDGTLWVNIGDSYTSDGFNRNSVKLGSGIQADQRAKNPDYEKQTAARGSRYYLNCGLKAKDLIGIPWMLAFALRADGWYLRQDIIWAKPNPMPESVKDRCTKSHEYIFLLSKSAKYYYDSEAVKEESIEPIRAREKNNGESAVDTKMRGYDGNCGNTGTRNKRDVWTVTTKPYKGAHFATFNPDLIKPCILAGAPETCCAKCGAPYERVIEMGKVTSKGGSKTGERATHMGIVSPLGQDPDKSAYNTGEFVAHEHITTGFQPTCTCNAGTTKGIVFDPFVGSGTTVATAIQLGRKGIGIDLSFKYLHENAKVRVDEQRLPLLEIAEAHNDQRA